MYVLWICPNLQNVRADKADVNSLRDDEMAKCQFSGHNKCTFCWEMLTGGGYSWWGQGTYGEISVLPS